MGFHDRSTFRRVLMLSGAGSATGASALLGAETDGLAIDFRDMSMVIRDTVTPANNFSGDPNNKLTVSGSATKTILDPSGVFNTVSGLQTAYSTTGVRLGVWFESAKTNLFLNSRSPATQNITVAAVSYTLALNGTGTITLSGVSSAGPLVGTGVNDRVLLTFTPTAGTLTLTCSGTLDYVQLEAGANASSPIATAGASVTRAIDVASIAASLFPYSATEGTIRMSAYIASDVDSGSGNYYWALSDGTASNRMLVFEFTGSRGIITTATVSQFDSTVAPEPTTGVVNTTAMAYKLNDCKICANGVAGTTDTAATIPTVNIFNIGTGPGGTAALDGIIRDVLYLPGRMPDVEVTAASLETYTP